MKSNFYLKPLRFVFLELSRVSIILNDIQYCYPGTSSKILDRLSFSASKGQTVVLFGASGSGKSTILNLIAAFLAPNSGQIIIDGQEVVFNQPSPNLAYIRQSSDDMIFPWKNVWNNLIFPLKLRDRVHDSKSEAMNNLLSDVRLDHRKTHFPSELSGGERRRLSLAMAFSYSPSIMLMDEPFTGIDLPLRLEIWSLIADKIKANGITTILVTHDFDEAVYLADKIIFLTKNGGISNKVIEVQKSTSTQKSWDVTEALADPEALHAKKEAIEHFKLMNE